MLIYMIDYMMGSFSTRVTVGLRGRRPCVVETDPCAAEVDPRALGVDSHVVAVDPHEAAAPDPSATVRRVTVVAGLGSGEDGSASE